MMNHRDTQSLCRQAGIWTSPAGQDVQVMLGKKKLKLLKNPTPEELDTFLRKEAVAEIDYMTSCF